MRPKSLSASALNVAELCLARYEAESIDRIPRVENDAATLGTTCHAALEAYVKHKKFGKEPVLGKDWQLLEMFFIAAFAEHFGAAERTDPRYKDGLAMLKTWFERTDLDSIDVVSCEVKTSFEVKTSIGPIPFNYIWDRFDKLGEFEYKVVDYKTSKFNVNADDLRGKIQARCYGLAAQIQHPDAQRIWVEFDMLRHEPVGVVFTRQDNVETWKFIKEIAERIIAAKDPAPTLNDECRFCVKRMQCSAANSNANAGGLISLDYLEDGQIADLRAAVNFQLKALEQNLSEIDGHILSRARAGETLQLKGGKASADIKTSSRRAVDADRVRMLVGDAKFLQYGGGASMNIGNFEDLLKDPSLDADTVIKLRALVFKNTGNPYVSSKRKSVLS